jgi:hypothetical protein
MDSILYTIIFLVIMIAVVTVLNKLKIHPYFVVMLFFHGSIYLGGSVWEAAIWGPSPYDCHSTANFSWGLWWLVHGLIAISYVALYAINQSNYMDFDFSGIKWKDIAILSGLALGNVLFFGVLEDFGCYIIWGLDTFSQDSVAGSIHHSWVGPIPTFYLTAIPGLILIVVSLWYSRKIEN